MEIQLLNHTLYTDLDVEEMNSRLSLEHLEARLELLCSNYCQTEAGCAPDCSINW